MRNAALLVIIASLAALAYWYRDLWWQESPTGALWAPAQRVAEGPGVPAAADRAPRPPESELEQEAQEYVRDITEPEPEPIAAARADHFVRQDQVISLVPREAAELMTPEQILSDPKIRPETPITIVRETEQVELTTPQRLAEQARGDLDARVRVLDGDRVRETTAGELLEEFVDRADQPVTVLRTVEHVEITTAAELARDPQLEKNKPLRVIRQAYGLESATVGDLVMGRQAGTAEAVYYVRTVRDSDKDGIWGIVRDGLIDNFARGIALRRGEEINTYRVDIPRSADQMLPDRRSSLLGRLIYDKTLNSHVYNYRDGRMGRNPDLIYPGQEIVIISFTADELVEIYKHFVEDQGPRHAG